MRRTLALTTAALTLLAACGGGTSDDSGDDGSGSGLSRDVVNPQPPGQATVRVDGLELTLTEPGALACTISEDSITFSYRIGDNETTLGAGANLYDTGWLGAVDLVIANPADEAGPVRYFPDLATQGEGIAIDGDSMSYSGPLMKQPPNDGSNPPPVDAGDGTISVTC